MAQGRVKSWHKLAEQAKERAAREMADAEEALSKSQRDLDSKKATFKRKLDEATGHQ